MGSNPIIVTASDDDSSFVAGFIAGVSMLQTSEVVYSIARGFVDACALMPIVENKHVGDGETEFEDWR